MVYGRLTKRLRALNLSTFAQYCELLKNGDEQEINNLLNAMTTNITEFFRENHHFEFLKAQALPEIIQSRQTKTRIWSAGCSKGMEPYSIAMIIEEYFSGKLPQPKILATDIDTNVLETAQRGCYSSDELKGLSPERMRRWFDEKKSESSAKKMIEAKVTLKKYITFKQLNLLNQWPVKGPFDFIFCRNVLIYFDHPTQISIVNRFVDLIKPGGYLFLGHSENTVAQHKALKFLGKTIYQKEK